MDNKKHVHFIGIAGSAIAPLAVMMKQKGWKVTGSDHNNEGKGWEPAASLLANAGIQGYSGLNIDNITSADLIILGGAPLLADQENPEFVEAKKQRKNIQGFAYLVGKHIVKTESIVVAGSYGKTTTTGLLAWIFEQAGQSPSFMLGGKPVNFASGVHSTDSETSIIEGDEFVSVWGFDMTPRLLYYKPKYAIISAAKWDHVNVYPTEESFVETFCKFASLVAENKGELFLSASGQNNEKVLANFKGTGITYTVEGSVQTIPGVPDYTARDIKLTPEGTFFSVFLHNEKLIDLETQMIGRHNIENCLVAAAMAHRRGIDLDVIKKAVASYLGINRRQEIVGTMPNGAVIIDDFAHSSVKAQATLDALRSRYPHHKIIAVYSPRIADNDSRETLKWYKGAFDLADKVIIPKIPVKKSIAKELRIHGRDIIEAIQTTQPNAEYMPLDDSIIQYVKENTNSQTVVAFMSAGGWRGMIDKVMTKD